MVLHYWLDQYLDSMARAQSEAHAVNVLITGGCGYVGTKLTQAVLDRTPHHVTVLDTQWFGNHLPPDPRLTVCAMDVRTIDEFDLARFDTIFHLANIANDPSVDLNPYSSWEVNVLAGMRLIDRAARQGVKQFIFASSASVYGLKSEPQVTEDLELFPLSEYNKTKMVAERVVMSYADVMTTTIIRPATVCGYSPRMRLDLIVNLLTMQALTKGAITVLGGEQTRPNIHIDDLVDLYLFAFDRRLAGVYNAGFENLRVREIAEAVTREVPARDQGPAVERPALVLVCSDRLLATGFAPKRNVATRSVRSSSRLPRGRLKDEPDLLQRQLDEAAPTSDDGVAALIRLLAAARPGIVVFFLLSLVTVRCSSRGSRAASSSATPSLLLGRCGRCVFTSLWPLEAARRRASGSLRVCCCSCCLPDDVERVLQPAVGVLGRPDATTCTTTRRCATSIGSSLVRRRRTARSDPGAAASQPRGGGRSTCAGATLRLRPKGRVIALGTLAAFKIFSLGMGGGVK